MECFVASNCPDLAHGTVLDRKIAFVRHNMSSHTPQNRIGSASGRDFAATLSSPVTVIGSRRKAAPFRAELSLGPEEFLCRLWASGRLLLDGRWSAQVSFDGISPAANSRWEQVCEFADREAYHREYERRCSRRIRHQRQITLCPRDGIAVLADTFLGPRSGRWGVEISLRFAEEVHLSSAGETYELRLATDSWQGVAIPLSFPEWRQIPTVGSLRVAGRELNIRYEIQGRGCYLPLFLAIWPTSPDQLSEPSEGPSSDRYPPLTWRHLTVSECLRKVADDEAVGYRIQIGDRQWVLYRSLTPPANRAVLGKNLISESLLGRFKSDGTIWPLVEVELEEDDS